MTPQFEALVDHARQSAPEDLAFNVQWLQSPYGWVRDGIRLGERVRTYEDMNVAAGDGKPPG